MVLIRTLTVILGLLFTASGAYSAKIVQCEDADGNRTYQSSCPPGTTAVETKQYYTGPKNAGPDLEQLKAEHPVTLYMVPTCEACDVVRSYLDNREIPYAEKNVSNDVKLQEELMAISGELSVPVVTIGEETVSGYNKPVLEGKLNAAGYPDGSEAPAAGADNTAAANR